MLNQLKSADNGLKVVFWKWVAAIAEFALQHKAKYLRTRPYLPLIAAGCTAFIIGRIAGSIFINGLP